MISSTECSDPSASSTLVPTFPVAPTTTTRMGGLYPPRHRVVLENPGTPARDNASSPWRKGELMGASAQETGQVTGTKDKDYNIIWFTEQCLSNTLRLESYIQDAEREGDSELAEFFRRAQGESRKGAEQGKEMLRKRLAK